MFLPNSISPGPALARPSPLRKARRLRDRKCPCTGGRFLTRARSGKDEQPEDGRRRLEAV